MAFTWLCIRRPDGHEDLSMPVIAETGGRIRAVFVRPGDYVHAGDSLVQLDTSELLAEQHNLERRIHLAEAVSSDRSRLSALYDEFKQTQLRLNGMTIVSPVDGYITFVASIPAGTLVSNGTIVGTVTAERKRQDSESKDKEHRRPGAL